MMFEMLIGVIAIGTLLCLINYNISFFYMIIPWIMAEITTLLTIVERYQELKDPEKRKRRRRAARNSNGRKPPRMEIIKKDANFARIVLKALTTVYLLLVQNTSKSELLWIGVIPITTFYLFRLSKYILAQAKYLKKNSGVYTLVYYFSKFFISCQVCNLLRRFNGDDELYLETTRDTFWLFLPLIVKAGIVGAIILIVTTYSVILSFLNKCEESKEKRMRMRGVGNRWLITLSYIYIVPILSIFLEIFSVRRLNFYQLESIRIILILVILCLGMVLFAGLGIRPSLKIHLKSAFLPFGQNKLGRVHQTGAGRAQGAGLSQSGINNDTSVINPILGNESMLENNQRGGGANGNNNAGEVIDEELNEGGEGSGATRRDGSNVGSRSPEVKSKTSEKLENSVFSFNFVAKRNSTLFKNFKREDYKNLEELDLSLINKSQMYKFPPGQGQGSKKSIKLVGNGNTNNKASLTLKSEVSPLSSRDPKNDVSVDSDNINKKSKERTASRKFSCQAHSKGGERPRRASGYKRFQASHSQNFDELKLDSPLKQTLGEVKEASDSNETVKGESTFDGRDFEYIPESPLTRRSPQTGSDRMTPKPNNGLDLLQELKEIRQIENLQNSAMGEPKRKNTNNTFKSTLYKVPVEPSDRHIRIRRYRTMSFDHSMVMSPLSPPKNTSSSKRQSIIEGCLSPPVVAVISEDEEERSISSVRINKLEDGDGSEKDENGIEKKMCASEILESVVSNKGSCHKSCSKKSCKGGCKGGCKAGSKDEAPSISASQRRAEEEKLMTESMISQRRKKLDEKIEQGERAKGKDGEDDEQKLCIICMERTPDCIFHPCGHGGICFGCASKIVEKNAICHFCRKPVKKVLKIDLDHEYKNIYRVLEVFRVTTVEVSDDDDDDSFNNPDEDPEFEDDDDDDDDDDEDNNQNNNNRAGNQNQDGDLYEPSNDQESSSTSESYSEESQEPSQQDDLRARLQNLAQVANEITQM